MNYLKEYELFRSMLFNSFLTKPNEFLSRLNKHHIFFATNPNKARVSSPKHRVKRGFSLADSCFKSEDEESSARVAGFRTPFDLNLAVVLAGFAFEAYISPPNDMGWREIDAAQCRTVILSDSFLREVYDGQLYIKLQKGVDLPAMDPWGTSDPYVIFQLNGQIAKSNVKWGTTDPHWNEDFTLNIKLATTKKLLVNVWDANLLTPHKQMGNGWVDLESLCDAFQAIYMRFWLN